MSTKTKRRLDKALDRTIKVLNGLMAAILLAIAGTLQILGIHLTWNKSKYQKRQPTPRPIIHPTYNRTIIVREGGMPAPRPVRTYAVSQNK